MSYQYVNGQISNPPSGLNVYLGEEAVKEISGTFSIPVGAFHFRFLGLAVCVDGTARPGDRGTVVRLVWEPTDSRSRTLAKQPKSPFERLTFAPFGSPQRDESGWEMPFFGAVTTRLYLCLQKGRPPELLVHLPRVLPEYRARQRRSDSREEKAAPVQQALPLVNAPDSSCIPVQLQLPGQPTLEFSVPTAEAFGLALDWTRKGYAS